MALPVYDANALTLNIELAMKQFPASEIIQSSCSILAEQQRTCKIQKSNATTAMASMGAFELLTTAIQRFPAEARVATEGSYVLGIICKHYFADKSKSRNTRNLAVVVTCLSHHVTNYGDTHRIMFAMDHTACIIIESSFIL